MFFRGKGKCMKVVITYIIVLIAFFYTMWTILNNTTYPLNIDSTKSEGFFFNSDDNAAKATEIKNLQVQDNMKTLTEKVQFGNKEGDRTNEVQLKTNEALEPLNNIATSTTKEVATTLDFAWKTLSKDWKLFSSYIDERYFKSKDGVFEKSLVTMGLEIASEIKQVLCVVIWANNTRSVLKENALRILIAESWRKRVHNFRSFLYRCRLPIADTPRYLTLTSRNVANFDTIPHSSFVPVINPKSRMLHQFGVCIQSPLTGDKYRQIIIDSVEMNRLLGAEWFTVYVHQAHQEALDILQAYTKEGILEAVYNWGKNIPYRNHNNAGVVSIQDCLYRNMYKVRYLVFCDFDEIIIPQKHLDWHDLFNTIESKDLAFFSFRQVAFHKNTSRETEYLQCAGKSGKKYHMPQYLATRNRSVEVLRGFVQAKSIIKPNVFLRVTTHRPGEMIYGGREFRVPPQLALLQHFRDQDDLRYKYSSTIDHSMEKYKWALLTAVKKRICNDG